MVTRYRTAVPGTSGTRISRHSLPVPAAAAGFVVLAVALRDGGTGGAGFYAGLVLFGFGMGGGFSPLMARALARVPVADAAGGFSASGRAGPSRSPLSRSPPCLSPVRRSPCFQRRPLDRGLRCAAPAGGRGYARRLERIEV
jgi:hypothetical protein